MCRRKRRKSAGREERDKARKEAKELNLKKVRHARDRKKLMARMNSDGKVEEEGGGDEENGTNSGRSGEHEIMGKGGNSASGGMYVKKMSAENKKLKKEKGVALRDEKDRVVSREQERQKKMKEEDAIWAARQAGRLRVAAMSAEDGDEEESKPKKKKKGNTKLDKSGACVGLNRVQDSGKSERSEKHDAGKGEVIEDENGGVKKKRKRKEGSNKFKE